VKPQSPISFFLSLCTTFDGASFSWMFDSKLQGPKYTASSMAANGQLGRGRSEGVFA